MIRQLIKFVLFALILILVQRFCHKQTDGFAVEKILSSHPYRSDWDIVDAPSAETLRKILDQKFHYLAKGAQSYVFASEDGKYVLKFFRHSHMRPLFLSELLFSPFFPHLGAKKKAKLEKDYRSYKIAYDEMREETGIIFLHLNQTSFLLTDLNISDKLHIHHCLDADRMNFLLQKRAVLVYPKMERWIEEKQIEQAKKGIEALVDLLALRAKKGILDKDPDLNTNFGFIAEKAIQIDIGRFKKENFLKNSEDLRDELTRITESFRYWLDARSPELSYHLQNKLKNAPLN